MPIINGFIIPEIYEDITDTVPDMGEESKMYQHDSNGTHTAIYYERTRPIDELPFEEDSLIEKLHKEMAESEGIIEVKSGKLHSGNKFIYYIKKVSLKDNNGFHSGNVYILQVQTTKGNKQWTLAGHFIENGITGGRDNTVLSLIRGQYQEMSIKDFFEKVWSKDPYDDKYKRGFLMNISEAREYDEMFPDHPLSEARSFIKFFIENN